MATDAHDLTRRIEEELRACSDARVVQHVRSLLIEPKLVMYHWDYGAPGQQYPCWIVLEDGSTGIAYCESGFGPRTPWGLVFLRGYLSMGMDSAWYDAFLEPYFEGMAEDLPIWRVFKTNSSGRRVALTPEAEWKETWERVYAHRAADPEGRYDCDADAWLKLRMA